MPPLRKRLDVFYSAFAVSCAGRPTHPGDPVTDCPLALACGVAAPPSRVCDIATAYIESCPKLLDGRAPTPFHRLLPVLFSSTCFRQLTLPRKISYGAFASNSALLRATRTNPLATLLHQPIRAE